MKRSMIVLFMICGLVLGGCQVATVPQDVSYFSTNRAASMEKAVYNGTFILYGDDDAAVTGPVLMTVRLKPGEPVGFEVDPDQMPYAVAGHSRLKLAPGRYRWETTPDKGQVDWNQTNVLTVEIVVAAAVIVIAVVTTLLATKAL